MARSTRLNPEIRDARLRSLADLEAKYDYLTLMELRRRGDVVFCSANSDSLRDLVSVPRDAYDAFSKRGYPTVGELKCYLTRKKEK